MNGVYTDCINLDLKRTSPNEHESLQRFKCRSFKLRHKDTLSDYSWTLLPRKYFQNSAHRVRVIGEENAFS